MIDTSGPILTPHVATLIPCLLKASGELETPKLSHISTQLSANAEAQELIDSMRAEAAKQNQSTDTLTKVLSTFLNLILFCHSDHSFRFTVHQIY